MTVNELRDTLTRLVELLQAADAKAATTRGLSEFIESTETFGDLSLKAFVKLAEAGRNPPEPRPRASARPKVDLAALAETMAGYGPGYLLTVSDDHRPHAVAVRPQVQGQTLSVGPLGRRTLANLAERPVVTLLFPPRDEGGYSLIVDGRATVGADGAAVAPAHAVLHRPADHVDTPTDGSCGNDCVPVGTD